MRFGRVLRFFKNGFGKITYLRFVNALWPKCSFLGVVVFRCSKNRFWAQSIDKRGKIGISSKKGPYSPLDHFGQNGCIFLRERLGGF